MVVIKDHRAPERVKLSFKSMSILIGKMPVSGAPLFVNHLASH